MEKLTVGECIEQFRMYAKATAINPEKEHSINFCADFLRDFCKDASQPVQEDAEKEGECTYFPECVYIKDYCKNCNRTA